MCHWGTIVSPFVFMQNILPHSTASRPFLDPSSLLNSSTSISCTSFFVSSRSISHFESSPIIIIYLIKLFDQTCFHQLPCFPLITFLSSCSGFSRWGLSDFAFYFFSNLSLLVFHGLPELIFCHFPPPSATLSTVLNIWSPPLAHLVILSYPGFREIHLPWMDYATGLKGLWWGCTRIHADVLIHVLFCLMWSFVQLNDCRRLYSPPFFQVPIP